MGKNHSNQNKNRFDAFPYKLIPVQSECYLPKSRKAFCSVQTCGKVGWALGHCKTG